MFRALIYSELYILNTHPSIDNNRWIGYVWLIIPLVRLYVFVCRIVCALSHKQDMHSNYINIINAHHRCSQNNLTRITKHENIIYKINRLAT